MELLSVNRLTIAAGDIINHATKTLVQKAHTALKKVQNFSLDAKGLLKMNRRQQVITAEEDLRMDAKRINMG